MHTATLAPVLLTSAVTGDGLDLVRLFYNLLPPRQRWAERARPSTLRMACAESHHIQMLNPGAGSHAIGCSIYLLPPTS